MYHEKLVECSDCGDRFKIIYDSRKECQDKYTCECGKFVCYPDCFGSFSYDRKGNYKEIPYEEREYKFEYYEEDYIRLTDEEQDLLSEIDKIGLEFGEGYLSPYSNRTDEDSVWLELSGCSKSNESLIISLKVRLQSYGNSWSETEIIQCHERLLEGLNRFKETIIKVKNKEIDLDKPNKIWDDNSLKWHDGVMKQHKKYDYELYC